MKLKQALIPFNFVTHPSKKLVRKRKALIKKKETPTRKPNKKKCNEHKTQPQQERTQSKKGFHLIETPNGDLLTASDLDLSSTSCDTDSDDGGLTDEDLKAYDPIDYIISTHPYHNHSSFNK